MRRDFASFGTEQALGRERIGNFRDDEEKGDGKDVSLTSLRIGADSLTTRPSPPCFALMSATKSKVTGLAGAC